MTTPPELKDGSIASLFEQQASLTPEAVAVESDQSQLTYRELNERSSQLANYLVRQGISIEAPVGIFAERSVDLVVAILGVLKAGGVYVPLDPNLPQQRLVWMVQNAGIALLLVDEQLKSRLPAELPRPMFLNECRAAAASESPEVRPVNLTRENLAYIVYTSGSTGAPKGVMIPHRVFMRCEWWAREVFRFTSADRFLFRSIRAPEELWYPLLMGARLIIAPPGAERDPSLFVSTLINYRITVVGLSPAFLKLVLAEPLLPFAACLNHVLCSGEILPNDIQNDFHLRCHGNLYNFYGLAEAPFTALWRCATEPGQANVPVGHPVDAQISLLGPDLQPVAKGDVGEIHIGGPGIARGYLNLPDLTAQRFISDPSSKNRTIYRTGDLAYYDADREGALILLGRTDLQIKVRGFRLEVGEVEAAVRMHLAVRDTAVALGNNEQGQSELTAYLVLERGVTVTVDDLRKFLEPKIPDHAIPSQFRVLSSLPLTATGKLDRLALNSCGGTELPRGAAYVAPRNANEQRLVQIWQDLLGRDRIGIDDNFFHLGGHSLSATQVVARIRTELGCELPLREFFEGPTIAELDSRLSKSTSVKEMIFRRRSGSGPAELSFAQERLWFLDQLEPGSSAYHIPDAYLVNGPLDVTILERSLRAVAQRHELLRTTLPAVDGKPLQVISPTSDLTISSVDRNGLSEIEQEAEIRRQIWENSATVFNLARGPLLQLKVVRLAVERYLLLVNMHHVVADDWSLGVFYRELSLFYNAFLDGKELDLPPLPIQYADYALCQRKWLENGALEQQLGYWRRQLSDTPSLELPIDFPRPPRQTFVGSRIPFQLSRDLTDRLKQFAREENVTHFMTLLGAFQILLSRYSGQQDVVVGTPIANRRHVELEGLFGFFVNMLVLRGDLAADPSFGEVIARIRRTAVDAYQHQDLPFEKLVEELNPDRDLSRPPLFQVMFALQDVPTHPLTFSGMDVSRRVHAVHATHFDLELYLSTENDAWSGFVGYNTDLFAAATINRMIGHYQTLLESLLTNPDAPVFSAPILVPAEQRQMLQWVNDSADYGPPECIHQLFEQQAAKSPEAIAVQFEDRTLTYRELDLRADALAGELQELGAILETRIAVCVERSLEMVVALLAILKAGGTYVPIDIHFPADRITHILNDAGVKILIVHDSLRPLCDGFAGKVRSLNRPQPVNHANYAKADTCGHNAAYIYYTSGSTGRPKGVIIEHRSVVNFLRGMQREPGISCTDVVLALTTISFDPAVLDIFLPLSVGARIVVVPEADRINPDRLLELIHQSGATILQATPTAWQMLMCTNWKRKELRGLIGGEILTPELVREILSRCGELWNLYGPTETTVWSTTGRIDGPDHITIGRMIPNQRAYIVDARLQPVPIGIPGELLIGGAGVGRYYVAQPELTAERFIPDPFSAKPGARLYRTGDLCRFRPDGNIEFLGRIDHQVKIRGYRVEPGEIEAVLIEHPDVNQCVIVDRVEKSGEKRLVSYIVPSDPASPPGVATLREFLRRKLPDYMVPAAFVVMEKLPLTRTGKVDRSALPATQPVQRDSSTMETAPRNQVERRVLAIWEEILQIKGIGLTDDFFQIGGHSLLAVRVMAEINSAFNTELPLATIFRSPTVENIALAVVSADPLQLKPPGLIAPSDDEEGQRIFWAPSVGSVERFVECHNLARLLRGRYRFYGFDPAPELADINRLAEHCLGLIYSEQPQGPYYIAGYCQCGHVAYEIATRLERDGHEVALLAIIDSSARDFAPNLHQRLVWVRDGLRGNPRLVLKRVRSVVRRKLGRVNPIKGLVVSDNQPTNRFVPHGQAAKRHRVRRFSGTVELIRSEQWFATLPHAPKLGWDALTDRVRLHPVACDHFEVLTDPTSVQLIVDLFKDSLPCQLV